MHLIFGTRGHLLALAVFAGILLLAAALLVVHLRQRPDRRGWTIFGFLLLAVSSSLTTYDWLFRHTFFELRARPDAGRVELKLIVPERHVAWPLGQIASIHGRQGSGLGRRYLVLVTRDGQRYESPSISPDELRRALEALRPLGKEL
jgi:hypothetical protein